jgi:hypothetical protein
VSSLNGLIDRLASYKSTAETTGESITCSVGVDDLVIGDSADIVDLVAFCSLGHDGVIGSLGDDYYSGFRLVLLGESSDLLGNLSNVGSL